MNLSGIWNSLPGLLGSQQADKSASRASNSGVNQPGSEGVVPNGGKTDHADLSSGGLAVAQSANQSISDVRMDKVNSVRAAIANGTYQVSAHDVADKVIQSLLD